MLWNDITDSQATHSRAIDTVGSAVGLVYLISQNIVYTVKM